MKITVINASEKKGVTYRLKEAFLDRVTRIIRTTFSDGISPLLLR